MKQLFSTVTGLNISLVTSFRSQHLPPWRLTAGGEEKQSRKGEITQERQRKRERTQAKVQSAGPSLPPVKNVGIYKPNVSNQCKYWLGHGRRTTVRVPKSTQHSKTQSQSKDTDTTSQTAAAPHTHLSNTACKRTLIFNDHACTFIRN